LRAVSSSSPAHPQFGHAGLDLGVIGADEAAQDRADLAIGFFEASAMGIAIELVPLVGEASGPFLAGLGLAMDLFANGFPGIADGAHLRGGGEQGLHVVAHGELPGKGSGVRGEDRVCRERPLWRSGLSAAEAVRMCPKGVGGYQVAERHGGRFLGCLGLQPRSRGFSRSGLGPPLRAGESGRRFLFLAPFTGLLGVGLQPCDHRRLKPEHREAP
jgi:hypothetical protein